MKSGMIMKEEKSKNEGQQNFSLLQKEGAGDE